MSVDFLNKYFGGTKWEMVPRPDSYRFVAKEGEREYYKGNDYYSQEYLGNYFQSNKDQLYKWLFFNFRDSTVFNQIPLTIPVPLILSTMVHLAIPVAGGFIETNFDEDFLAFNREFFKHLFWAEDIYVSYDFWSNSENYEFGENVKLTDDLKRKVEFYANRGGFNSWIKLTGVEDDGDIQFMHIKSGIVVKVENWEELFIHVCWGTHRTDNFLSWFRYAVDWLLGCQRVGIGEKFLLKRVHVRGNRDLSNYAKDVENRINSDSTILISDDSTQNSITGQGFLSGADLRDLQHVVFARLDRQSYELGRVSNTNPKGERMSTGENYKDITGIANRQKDTLIQLKWFSAQVSEKFGIDLNFAISGIPEKEKLETEGVTAPHPNTGMEKEDLSGGSGFAGHR